MVPTKPELLKDIASAAERMGLDGEDLLGMLDEVLDDCIGKVEKLAQAASSGDAVQTSAIAHDIKGSTLNYGITAPSVIAKEIEAKKLEAAGRIPELKEVLLAIKAMDLAN
ncbi:MAG: hypothetical protein A2557_10700 [Candidatus Lambdaproteobacteria bacterium RIFOXYD2_FULL_56_26]|uniref:HPt domain-containing protein n=1 Tax=Candidatus Lambdaproteobacteria bacterium RIFOXYD2_FULL_56_26 TaxID=1817773 RepID=A0A1F6H1K9_9PROT|nr:MAG: hypothetical protein A2557_10700 [Candidatus Lambdaproteobacteria bacterium RIFOXYD2_FULL_56_26]